MLVTNVITKSWEVWFPSAIVWSRRGLSAYQLRGLEFILGYKRRGYQARLLAMNDTDFHEFTFVSIRAIRGQVETS